MESSNMKFCDSKFYRITYEGEGIYDALKNHVDFDTWKKLLSLKEFSWLPKPPSYCSNYLSLFTELGYQKFLEFVFPVLCKYLNQEKITTHVYKEINNIIYIDLYQVVIRSDRL